MILGESVDGPLEEKYAICGAGLKSITETVGNIVPIGLLQIHTNI